MLLMCHQRGEPSGTWSTRDVSPWSLLQEFVLKFLEVTALSGALRMALSPYPLSSTPGERPTVQLQAWEERMDLALGSAAKSQCCP